MVPLRRLVLCLTWVALSITLWTRFKRTDLSHSRAPQPMRAQDIARSRSTASMGSSTSSSAEKASKVKVISAKTDDFLAKSLNDTQRIKEMCEKYGENDTVNHHRYIGQAVAPRNMFTVLPQLHFLWCRSGKAGTSSWRKILNAVRQHMNEAGLVVFNRTDPHSIKMGMQKKLALRDNEEDPSSMLTFINVRHPINRLYSCFHDKIISGHIQLREVNYPGDPSKATFETFLKTISTRPRFNTHWTPTFAICKPCEIHYDFVVRMESFQADSELLLEQLGDYGKVQVPQIHVGSSSQFQRVQRTPQDVHRFILRDVSAKVIRRTVKFFYFDFLLFGYDAQSILDIADEKDAHTTGEARELPEANKTLQNVKGRSDKFQERRLHSTSPEPP